jgi:hypothetical protein
MSHFCRYLIFQPRTILVISRGVLEVVLHWYVGYAIFPYGFNLEIQEKRQVFWFLTEFTDSMRREICENQFSEDI